MANENQVSMLEELIERNAFLLLDPSKFFVARDARMEAGRKFLRDVFGAKYRSYFLNSASPYFTAADVANKLFYSASAAVYTSSKLDLSSLTGTTELPSLQTLTQSVERMLGDNGTRSFLETFGFDIRKESTLSGKVRYKIVPDLSGR